MPDNPLQKVSQDFGAFVTQGKEKISEMSQTEATTQCYVPQQDEKYLAMATYTPAIGIITCIVVFFINSARGSRFVTHHLWQAFVVHVLVILLNTLLPIVIGYPGFLGWLVVMGIFGYLMYQTYCGQWLRVPLVYRFSQKIHIFAEELMRKG